MSDARTEQEKLDATEEIKQRVLTALAAVRETLKNGEHLYFTDVVRLRTAFDMSKDYRERMELLSLIRIHDHLTDLRDLYQALR